MPAAPKVFISHATADAPFIEGELLPLLDEHGIRYWYSKDDIRSGEQWERSIRSGLEGCDGFLVILSPRAAASDWVQTEVHWALEHRRQRYVPVLLEDTPESDWPLKLFKYQFVDYRGSRAEARRRLLAAFPPAEDVEPAAERRRLGKLHNVPELPPHFLPRPEELHALKDVLLAGAAQPVGITGAGRAGLHGMGGIGKSVLAAAVARDEDVRAAFPDGVFWVTVGQTPALTALQLQLARALGSDPGVFNDVAGGRDALRELLAGRACLLVLDDVWQAEPVAAFEALGPRCRMLLTTRDGTLITSLGAAEGRLGVLPDEQALRLLAEWAGQDAAALPEAARQVLGESGRLPLALATCGAMARDGVPWADLVQALREADLSFLDRAPAHYPYQDVLRSLAVGVECLARQDPQAASCYRQLAVFPADEEVPEAAVVTLWRHESGLPERHARKLLTTLERKALLRLDGQPPDRRVSLHDLQHDYLRASQADLQGLHERLLAAYRAGCPDGWPSGPKDGYFFEHLGRHLLEAGRRDELHALLLDFRWLRAKLGATGVNALLADYDRLPDDADVTTVQGALRLSAHVLAREPAQLPGQLLGRLLSHPAPAILSLLEQARAGALLFPLTGSLTPPGGPLLRTLEGHTGMVNAVALTPDGRLAVSGSKDRTLKVWELGSGRLLRSLEGHTGSVHAVAVTADGRLAVSGSWDSTLMVWELGSGRLLRTLEGHTGWVNDLAVTPDGRLVVSGSDDKTLKVWELGSGWLVRSLEGHTDWVSAVAVTPDGRFAVSGSHDKTLKVWELGSGRLVRSLEGHTDWVNAVALTPDGRLAVSGSHDRTLKVWELGSGRLLRSLEGHTDMVSAVAVTPDGRHAVSGSTDQTLKVWELDSGRLLYSVEGHTSSVLSVALTPDGHLAVSGSTDHTLKVWELGSGRLLCSLKGHTGSVLSVAVTPDGRHAVSGSLDNTLKVWELGSGRLLRSLVGHTSHVRAVAVTGDGHHAISGSDDKTLKVWELGSGRLLRTLEGHTDHVLAVAVTPDGRHAVSGSLDNTLKVWELGSGRLLRTLEGHTNPVRSVAVTPDGRHAVSGSEDHTLKVWELGSGRLLRSLEGHTSVVYAVAVTPDGRHAVSGSEDHTLKVWELGSGRLLRSLEGHTGAVYAVAVTLDGRFAVSGSRGRMLKLWDLAGGKVMATCSADGEFLACAVAPDGRTVVAGDALGRVHFLRLALGEK